MCDSTYCHIHISFYCNYSFKEGLNIAYTSIKLAVSSDLTEENVLPWDVKGGGGAGKAVERNVIKTIREPVKPHVLD